jgi:hypothetical protein
MADVGRTRGIFGALQLKSVSLVRKPKIACDLPFDHPFGEPIRRFSPYPVQRVEAGFEFANLLNGTVGPFGFDLPILTIRKDDAKKRLWCCHFRLARATLARTLLRDTQ